MAPAELASVLTEVIGDARAEMAGIVAETFEPLAPGRMNLREGMPGDPSLDSTLERLTSDLQSAREAGRARGRE